MIVLLEYVADAAELLIDIGIHTEKSIYLLRSPYACDNILALSIHEILAIELILT